MSNLLDARGKVGLIVFRVAQRSPLSAAPSRWAFSTSRGSLCKSDLASTDTFSLHSRLSRASPLFVLPLPAFLVVLVSSTPFFPFPCPLSIRLRLGPRGRPGVCPLSPSSHVLSHAVSARVRALRNNTSHSSVLLRIAPRRSALQRSNGRLGLAAILGPASASTHSLPLGFRSTATRLGEASTEPCLLCLRLCWTDVPVGGLSVARPPASCCRCLILFLHPPRTRGSRPALSTTAPMSISMTSIATATTSSST